MTVHHDKSAYERFKVSSQELNEEEVLQMMRQLSLEENDVNVCDKQDKKQLEEDSSKKQGR